MHCILNSLRNILPQANFVVVSLCRVIGYVCQLLLLIWASYRLFLDRLPEVGYNLYIDVLLIMYCMCLPAFFVTSADKSQLLVYLCYLLIYCLRLLINK